MREGLGSEQMAQLVGDLTVVIAATAWSVLVFSMLAALVIALLNALSSARMSIKGTVWKVAAVALVVAGGVHVRTGTASSAARWADTILSMAEFAALPHLASVTLAWGALAACRVRESRSSTRSTAMKRRGR
jgi:signal transduction histidine kinase